jgi:hypothetical protein
MYGDSKIKLENLKEKKSKSRPGMEAHICNSCYFTQEAETEGYSQSPESFHETLSEKHIKSKRTGGLLLVVELLPTRTKSRAQFSVPPEQNK